MKSKKIEDKRQDCCIHDLGNISKFLPCITKTDKNIPNGVTLVP